MRADIQSNFKEATMLKKLMLTTAIGALMIGGAIAQSTPPGVGRAEGANFRRAGGPEGGGPQAEAGSVAGVEVQGHRRARRG
jgi:hypothetical protein